MDNVKNITDKQKIIYVLTAIFYLMAGQIYPYLHLHSHDHNGDVEFELCANPAASEPVEHHCCDSHTNDHSHAKNTHYYLTTPNPKPDKSHAVLINIDSFPVYSAPALIIQITESYFTSAECGLVFLNKAPPMYC